VFFSNVIWTNKLFLGKFIGFEKENFGESLPVHMQVSLKKM
jgi:hypothetical protein